MSSGKDCKKRHIKCDEKRPACSACLTTDRRCSFLHLQAVRPPASVSPGSGSGLGTPSVVLSQSSTPTAAAAVSPSSPYLVHNNENTPISFSSSSPSFTAATTPTNPPRSQNAEPTPCFDMRHLVLLHHLENQVIRSPSSFPLSLPMLPPTAAASDTNTSTNGQETEQDQERKCYEAIFESAVSAPYLMYELLAFSALHLSTTTTTTTTTTAQIPDKALHQQQQYSLQAAELQARALSLFNNDRPEVHDKGNYMSLFIFSAILGMHTLHNNLASAPSSLSSSSEHEPSGSGGDSFLDRITHYLRLHRGVSAVLSSSQSWHVLRNTEIRYIIDAIETGEEAVAATPPRGPQQRPLSGEENDATDTTSSQSAAASSSSSSEVEAACEKLEARINKSRTSDQPRPSPTEEQQKEALDALLWVCRLRRVLPKPYPTHMVLAWPVRIPAGFVELLEQREPVALTILAHWAVLLHEDRDFWVFGNAGQNMIRALLTCLGPAWDEWMEVPRRILDNVY